MFSRIWSTEATTTLGTEEFEAEWFMVQKKQNIRAANNATRMLVGFKN
jgi:hypothetical protein